MAVLIHIDPDTSRDDLITCLNNYNQRAKLVARRGTQGTRSDHYRDLHDTISHLAEAIHSYDKAPA